MDFLQCELRNLERNISQETIIRVVTGCKHTSKYTSIKSKVSNISIRISANFTGKIEISNIGKCNYIEITKFFIRNICCQILRTGNL